MAQIATSDVLSPPAQTSPSSFTALPDELLDAIVHLLPSWYIVPALNRRLVPFNRAQRFKVIDAYISEPRYYRLNRCLRLNPVLGTFIQELRIEIPTDKLQGPPPLKKHGKNGKGKGGGNFEQEKAFKKLGTKEEELNHLLAVSTKVRHLEIYGSVEFIDTLSPGTDLFTRIPTLDRLVLDSRRQRYYQPEYLDDDEQAYFDPFDLSGLREIYGDPLSLFPSSQNLSFDLRLFACNNRKKPFLDLLSTLPISQLQIVHFGPRSDLIGLLEAIPQPESLSGLSLFALDNHQHLEKLFVSFANISSLSRGQTACDDLDPFYSVLEGLPLRHLHLGPGTQIDSDRILEFVSRGPEKLSTLSTLILDNIDAKMAPLRLEYDCDRKTRRYNEWVLPWWEPDFSKEGAEALKIAAIEAGVEVKGTTFYGLEIMETTEYKEDKQGTIKGVDRGLKTKEDLADIIVGVDAGRRA
ncbi:hypothetical protein JCM5353_006718 [Sporobolomyces roseus]